jgi:Putative zinc-finger
MNCSQLRNLLSEWLDGDVAPTTAVAVEAHLVACTECRREGEALKQVRQALDLVPPATAEVDLPQLYRTAAETQERLARRWRRRACVGGGLAAALALFAVLPALEVRIEGHQFVARWGSPPAVPSPVLPAPAPPEPAVERIAFANTTAPDVEDRLRLLGDLVQMMADDAGKRDERRRRDLETLRAQLNDLREQSRLWRLSAERDVAALYAVHFSQNKKGKEQ